jgi:hypothetical protein
MFFYFPPVGQLHQPHIHNVLTLWEHAKLPKGTKSSFSDFFAILRRRRHYYYTRLWRHTSCTDVVSGVCASATLMGIYMSRLRRHLCASAALPSRLRFDRRTTTSSWHRSAAWVLHTTACALCVRRTIQLLRAQLLETEVRECFTLIFNGQFLLHDAPVYTLQAFSDHFLLTRSQGEFR